MADSAIRELERRYLQTDAHEDKVAYLDSLCRAGRAVWVLKYGSDSCGLDNALVGIFWSHAAALEHLQRHQPGAFPGWCQGGSATRDARRHDQWATNDWRNLVLECKPVHAEVQEEWFCTRLRRPDG